MALNEQTHEQISTETHSLQENFSLLVEVSGCSVAEQINYLLTVVAPVQYYKTVLYGVELLCIFCMQ